MTTESLKELAETVIGALEISVSKALGRLKDRIDALEQRFSAIPTIKGEPGVDGKDGAPGDRGAEGPQGAPGADGAPGKDSTVQGPQGAPGADGGIGPQGAPGADGAAGKAGADGLNGKDGSDGMPGRDGRDGLDGKDGAPGMDALRIDPIDMIDESRSYPRGTYASHLGGLVRAVRTTDPLADAGGELVKAGWQVLVEGFRDAGLEISEDGRRCVLGIMLTSGKTHAKTFDMPTMIYRGIWREGDFRRGDTVTRDGSTWHCEVSGTKQVPGAPNASDWKLCVKRGSDGRDGKNGEPGPIGPAGTPGRDGRAF
jgi:hypothetical protein